MSVCDTPKTFTHPQPLLAARPRSYTFDGSRDVALDVLRGACEVMALLLFCVGTWGVCEQYRRGGYFQVRLKGMAFRVAARLFSHSKDIHQTDATTVAVPRYAPTYPPPPGHPACMCHA